MILYSTGAIVWLDEKQGPIQGTEAKKIIRKGKLKMGGI
jgi:hypothetical protein